jgi:hypothetical protein
MPNMLSGAFDEDDEDASVVSPLRAPNLPHPIGSLRDSVDNSWDFASHAGDFMSERSGVLIIPADELEDAVAAGPGDRYETAMDLSVPGSDSFPSELGSLHDLTGSMNAAAREDPAQERLIDRDQEGESRRGLYSKAIVMVLFAMLVTSFLSSAFLFLERQSWHNTTLRLEEKIRQLEEQQVQQAKGQKSYTTLRLEEKIRQLEEQQAQQAKGQSEDPPPVFSWEKSGDAEDPEPTLLVDNCWFHAKANLELGKCANDAKKTAEKTLKAFGKTVDDVGKSWIEYMVGEEPDSAKSVPVGSKLKKNAKKTLKEFGKTVVKENKRFWNKVDDVGKTWIEYMAGEEPDSAKSESESVPVEPKGDMNSSGVTKITDTRTKAITDTAKTIASGLVYASLLFVVVDESFSFFSGSPPARAGATNYF